MCRPSLHKPPQSHVVSAVGAKSAEKGKALVDHLLTLTSFSVTRYTDNANRTMQYLRWPYERGPYQAPLDEKKGSLVQ
ncbi:MAG: hypothetical protein JO031_16520 [Ktedonobacteraceae bacterium]|nr:hypothetical protein [Ktedonobacteraceae bacterium]